MGLLVDEKPIFSLNLYMSSFFKNTLNRNNIGINGLKISQIKEYILIKEDPIKLSAFL